MADIKQILETMDKVMLGIKSATEMPGVSLIPYVGTLSGIIGTVHAAYTAGKNIEPYITAISDTFSKPGAPSQIDVDALDAKIAELEAQVQAPLPPKEEGEEE